MPVALRSRCQMTASKRLFTEEQILVSGDFDEKERLLSETVA